MKFLVNLCIAFVFLVNLSSCFIRPRHNFEAYNPPPKPDYSNENNWAALPNKKDNAHLVPSNSELKENEDSALVDVFFIHPTTYYKKTWNADVSYERLNIFTGKTTILHQGSVFNESCKIYAPRYRQATLYSFMDKNSNGLKALDLAYQDIRESFKYFLQNYNKGRPFIIASHSQGSRHAKRLLAEFIEKDTALYNRMVAAYIIGFQIKEGELTVIKPCHSATETNCFVTWNTVLKGKTSDFFRSYVCTNPLTWTTDTTYASHDKNLGSVPKSFKRIDKNTVDAQVINGLLNVTEPKYSGYPIIYGGSFHLVDYNLFYMNIRQNVSDRIKAYFAQKNR